MGSVFFDRDACRMLDISLGLATLSPSTLTITSPALKPAFSAVEAFVPDRASTPPLTPKKSPHCGFRESISLPKVRLRPVLNARVGAGIRAQRSGGTGG